MMKTNVPLLHRKAEFFLFAMVTLYAAFFLYYTLSKHYSFMTYMLDLGVYDHNLWLILNEGDPRFPFGTVHRSWLLYLILPIYAIHPGPETLLAIQAVVVPLAAIPLYMLAFSELRSKTLAIAVAGAYLLYPPLHGLSQFDFHLEAFLPLFFITMAYTFKAKMTKTYLVTLILTITSMTVVAYVTLPFALYLLLEKVKLGRGWSIKLQIDGQTKLTLATLALALVVIGLDKLTPSSLLLANGGIPAVSIISKWAGYLLNLYGPLAFIPFLSPSHLIPAAPWLAFTLLAGNPEYVSIYNQYSAYIAPFIFMGMVRATSRLISREPKHNPIHIVVLVLMATTFFLTSVDPVLAKPYWPHTPRWPTLTERDKVLHKIIQEIPSEASVLTQNNLAPHLTNRREIYITLPIPPPHRPDYILVDTTHFSYDEPNLRPSPAQIIPFLLSEGQYGLKLSCNGILVYKKGYMGETVGCPNIYINIDQP
jgi:uncharacterized membrane protein